MPKVVVLRNRFRDGHVVHRQAFGLSRTNIKNKYLIAACVSIKKGNLELFELFNRRRHVGLFVIIVFCSLSHGGQRPESARVYRIRNTNTGNIVYLLLDINCSFLYFLSLIPIMFCFRQFRLISCNR
jgi:hypothetical protein